VPKIAALDLITNVDGYLCLTDAAKNLQVRLRHAFLKVGKDFSTWIKKQIKWARLVEGRDFLTVAQKGVGEYGGIVGRFNSIEYYLTLEAGKHIAMLSGTDNGFEVRECFFECETVAKQQPVVDPEQVSQ